MRIGGLQKNSLIDFPGHIACVVFTSGCNFNCPYCHNPDLAAGPVNGAGGPYDDHEVFAFLQSRRGLLDGVVITGGEPTLQPDLPAFIMMVKELGFKVKLDSNGSRPQVLEMLLENDMIDYLAMDIKTGPMQYKCLMNGGTRIDAVLESIGLIMEKAPAYEFRTTCVRPFTDAGIMAEIARIVKGADRYVLQKCSRDVAVLEPGFTDRPDRFLSDPEMEGLKQVLEPNVETVLIR